MKAKTEKEIKWPHRMAACTSERACFATVRMPAGSGPASPNNSTFFTCVLATCCITDEQTAPHCPCKDCNVHLGRILRIQRAGVAAEECMHRVAVATAFAIPEEAC